MSKFYQYEFISPEPLYAKVKEELKSYFDTGAVDDVLFPVWTNDCLRKLGKGTLPIRTTTLYIDDFGAKLPKGFKYVREAWICTNTAPTTIRKPGAFYSQITTLLNPSSDPCEPTCGPCRPLVTELIYKTTTDEIFINKVSHLLVPGNVNAAEFTYGSAYNLYPSEHVFEIRDGKFWTEFREGDVFLIYYSLEKDDLKNQLIPENEAIEGYIEAYIKYKVFEQLWNQTSDETFNQVQAKYQEYGRKSDEALVIARTESIKKTVHQKVADMKKSANRLNRHRLR